MLLGIAWPKEPIQSEELDMLQELLRQWCEEHDCDIKGPEANSVAKELISWFEFGIKDKARLRKIIRTS
ncbi:MAG: hypothetical protein QHC90_04225 [Shinella sp.]|jgi:hypothetical protein|nr:hypothetical protein [Shinella sp.]